MAVTTVDWKALQMDPVKVKMTGEAMVGWMAAHKVTKWVDRLAVWMECLKVVMMAIHLETMLMVC